LQFTVFRHPRRDIEWAQAAREMLAAEKPKFIVMMIGNNDRQSIREKAVEAATQRVGAFNSSVFGVVAETGDGKIVGFNFLSERDPIRAIGPIVIDPAMQGHGIGRQLMEAILKRARGVQSVRLIQDSCNVQSEP
jgi:GNAT superfamily N-acetyltransferase